MLSGREMGHASSDAGTIFSYTLSLVAGLTILQKLCFISRRQITVFSSYVHAAEMEQDHQSI